MKKTIWVTGAGRGIGKAIAEKFVSDLWNVIASSRNISSKDFEGLTNIPYPLKCDVTKEADVLEAIGNIQQLFGSVDVLVNNAGIGYFKNILETSLTEFKEQLDVNLIGTFLCSQAVIPMMIKKKKGVIINIISVAGVKAFTNSGSYGASKAGVHMLSKVMREELKEYNIKVISVIPGATATGIWSPRVLEKYSDRMMKPDHIADAVYSAAIQPDDIITEEIILRPILGDL